MQTIEEVKSVHANRFDSVISSKKPYNWYHEHGLPDPANPIEILEYRIKNNRKAEAEDDFWNTKVAPNLHVSVEEAKVEEFLLPAGEWDEVEPQNIANVSDIKIGFRK